MRRYLASGPRTTTTTRCTSTGGSRNLRHHRENEEESEFRAIRPEERFTKNGTNRLSYHTYKSSRRSHELRDEHEVQNDFRASNLAEGAKRDYSENSNTTDPFAAFDADASKLTNGEPDFLKELRIYNEGVLHVNKKKARSKTAHHGEVDGEPPLIRKYSSTWKGDPNAPRSEGEVEKWSSLRDEGHKPREAIPQYLDEKYRYLTARDRYMYARESSGLENTREFARQKQKEWAARQVPQPPKISFPPDPIHETPELRELPYTPPSSLPTPRQLERFPMSSLLVPKPSFWTDKAYKLKPRMSEPKDWTPFQRKLHRNPYAETLSSPVRQCLIMKFVRLPRDFLISFEHMTNPNDGRNWIMPRELTKPVPESELRVRVPIVLSKGSSVSDVANQKSARAAQEAHFVQGTNKPERKLERFYILASKTLIQYITQKDDPNKRSAANPYFGKWQIMNHYGRLPGEERSNGEWHPNMPKLILQLMRQRVIHLIWQNLFKPEKHVQYRPDWEDIVKQKQMGCVLWLGREELTPRFDKLQKSKTADVKSRIEHCKEKEWGPAQYTTITNPPFWSKKLPVFNLLRLLGAEAVWQIRNKGPPVDTKRYIVVRDKPDTMEIRMWLWRIENYLAVSESEEEQLGRWEPRDDEDDAGEDVEFETVYVNEGGVEEDVHSEEVKGPRRAQEKPSRAAGSSKSRPREAAAPSPLKRGVKRLTLSDSSKRFTGRPEPNGW